MGVFEVAQQTPAHSAAKCFEHRDRSLGPRLGVAVQLGVAVVRNALDRAVELTGGPAPGGGCSVVDVGLDGLVSKKKADFLGKRSLEQSYLKGPNRKQLVGLLTEDPNDVLPDGAYAVRQVKDKPPMEMIGQVTSSYRSPTLGRSIAMALIENGRNRMGETISFPLPGGKVVRAKITDTVFYDKEGAKLNV